MSEVMRRRSMLLGGLTYIDDAAFVKANIPLFYPFAALGEQPETHDEWCRLNEPEVE